LTTSDKPAPTKTKPLAGGVRHDARGNAVWQWASETARHAAASTSQLLRRLDVSSLSLQDDESPPQAQARPGQARPGQARPAQPTPGPPVPAPKPAASARKAEGGFDPYDGAAMPAARAVKKRPAAQAAARASWWRRLLQRR
jgi:hypothetical protein